MCVCKGIPARGRYQRERIEEWVQRPHCSQCYWKDGKLYWSQTSHRTALRTTCITIPHASGGNGQKSVTVAASIVTVEQRAMPRHQIWMLAAVQIIIGRPMAILGPGDPYLTRGQFD